MPRVSARTELTVIGVAAIALFAGGVWMASVRLPEWRAESIPSRSFFSDRFQEAAQRARVVVANNPRLTAASRPWISEDIHLSRRDPVYQALGPAGPDWLTARGYGPYVKAAGDTRGSGSERGRLAVLFSLRGAPISLTLVSPKLSPPPREVAEILVPTPQLGEEVATSVLGQNATLFDVRGSQPREYIAVTKVPGSNNAMYALRAVGSLGTVRQRMESFDIEEMFMQQLPALIIGAILLLACAALFIVLLVKRRIDVTTGAILAALSLVFSITPRADDPRMWVVLLDSIGSVIGRVIVIFVVWSATESWIRATSPDFRTNLDAIRAGRIGPAGGRALMGGWFVGAAAAGIGLMAMTLLTHIWGISPTDASVHLSIFDKDGSPVGVGVLRAGFVLLAIGASVRVPGLRRIPFLAAILGGLFLSISLPVSEFWFAVLMGVAIATLFVFAYQRFGLAAVLVASVIYLSLPAAVFCAKHFDWLRTSALLATAITAAPLVAGAIGLRRRVEETPVKAPGFARRLEQERRLQYEMDLLARMQIGLLPRETPRIEGYELAAKSLLATEAGGDLYDFLDDERGQIWIAAGDVSGHGFSCAIAQAMTKAGLASLINAEQTPAMVLTRLDHVLRKSGSSRTFTSLALLRLDPARGEGLLANAGHPYPLYVYDGRAGELALPSLPLGQGPPRHYEDLRVSLEPGSALVFYSDGLFEAADDNGVAYGFERIRQVLLDSRNASAQQLLDRILEDWRRHLGSAEPADDTTLVVLKRIATLRPSLGQSS